MTLRVTTTASGAGSGIARWIRDAANAINLALGRTEDHAERIVQAEADIIDLRATKLEWVEAPVNANDPGEPGQVAYEGGFFYVCVGTDTWERTALATW